MKPFFARFDLMKLTALVLWVGVGMLLAVLLHRLSLRLITETPTQQTIAATTTERSHSAFGRLLGASDIPTQRLSADRLRLVGFMASATGGIVSVSLDNGPVRQLILGRPASDGLLFQGVVDQQLVISLAGDTVHIPLAAPAAGLTVAKPSTNK